MQYFQCQRSLGGRPRGHTRRRTGRDGAHGGAKPLAGALDKLERRPPVAVIGGDLREGRVRARVEGHVGPRTGAETRVQDAVRRARSRIVDRKKVRDVRDSDARREFQCA